MKIYLIEEDNGLSYEDNHTWISGAFTSYRGASQILVKQGFTPYPFKYGGSIELRFESYDNSDEDMPYYEFARIIEMDLVDA